MRWLTLHLSAAFASCVACSSSTSNPGASPNDAGNGGTNANGTGASNATSGSANGGATGSTAGGASGSGAGGSASGGRGNGGNGAGGNGAQGGSSSGGTNAGGTMASGGTGGATTGTDGGARRIRSFPDTTSKISILADQFPNLSAAQQKFVVAHYVGTEKQTLAQSEPLRALDPDFLVLHYHLSMWQSAPSVDFIIDGNDWGNDYPTVTMHEDWFLHDAQNQRLASTADQKLLMNVSSIAFQDYWAGSLVTQVKDGDYDGIFFDSASPALLQGEVGGQDPRLAGTGARDSMLPELQNQTFIQAWEQWMTELNTLLANSNIPLIPNTSAFVTGWDNTDYSLTAGAFVEGFADPSFAESDWQASTNELLSLAQKHKILILQNYLSSTDDVAKRLYYLANYLLVKGDKTYLDYFASGPLEWYPEWTLDLGAPTKTAATVDDLADGAVYRRDFEKGVVLVNPGDSPSDVTLGATLQQVTPNGGGAVDQNGTEPGTVSTSSTSSVTIAAHSGAIFVM